MDVIIQKDPTEDIVVKLVRRRQLLINIIQEDIENILHIRYFVIFILKKDIQKDIQKDILKKDIQRDIQKDILKKDIQKEDYLVYFYFNLFFV